MSFEFLDMESAPEFKSYDSASVFGKGNNYHYYIFSKGGFIDGLLKAQERGFFAVLRELLLISIKMPTLS